MSHRAARCVRPYLFHNFKHSQCAALRRPFTSSSTIASSIKAPKDASNDYERRLAQLDGYKPRDEWYPRIATHGQAERTSVKVFQHEYAELANDETRDDSKTIIGTKLPSHVGKAHVADRQGRQGAIRPNCWIKARVS
jgi:hypothetical protein